MRITISITLIAVIIFLACCSKNNNNSDTITPPTLVFPAYAINFSLTKDSINADGMTTAELTLKIDSSFAQKYSQVTFSVTPIGNISGGTTSLSSTIGANGTAKVYITSLQAGISCITANITNLSSKNAYIHFIPAYPDQIVVQPSVATLTPSYSSSVSITANLIRSTGTVSAGLPVFYRDSTTINTSIGIFINSTESNTEGQSNATYSIQDTTYHGLLYIKSYTKNGNIRVIGMNKVVIQ